MNQSSEYQAALNVKQAAECLGMSQAWVRKQVFRRAIPHLKIGRSVRFERSALDAFLTARRIDAAARVDSRAERRAEQGGSASGPEAR